MGKMDRLLRQTGRQLKQLDLDTEQSPPKSAAQAAPAGGSRQGEQRGASAPPPQAPANTGFGNQPPPAGGRAAPPSGGANTSFGNQPPPSRGATQSAHRPHRPASSRGGVRGSGAPLQGLPDHERLVSLYAPRSPQGKRIDILRSQILYPYHGEPPRIIMITSSLPREGRSLLTANLAISFARGLQQYVMVMDCHLISPVQHELLGVSRLPGLADYLEGDADVPDILHWTSVDKLSCIPAGTPSQRPAEILATDKMANLMGELRNRYRDRYIILDTPPVQAFDDPAVLARNVEGIVFVVLTGRTDREVVMRGVQALPEEKIIGMVLNDQHDAVLDAYTVSGEPDTSQFL